MTKSKRSCGYDNDGKKLHKSRIKCALCKKLHCGNRAVTVCGVCNTKLCYECDKNIILYDEQKCMNVHTCTKCVLEKQKALCDKDTHNEKWICIACLKLKCNNCEPYTEIIEENNCEECYNKKIVFTTPVTHNECTSCYDCKGVYCKECYNEIMEVCYKLNHDKWNKCSMCEVSYCDGCMNDIKNSMCDDTYTTVCNSCY